MESRERELIAKVTQLTDRLESLQAANRSLREDLKAARQHAENTQEELDRLQRRLQALGTIEPGGEA